MSLQSFISPIVILLSIVIVADLLLARQILASNRRHPGNIFFSLVVLFAAMWTFLMLVGERLATSPLLISWSLRLAYLVPVWIIFFFYLFTYYFPYKTFHQLSKNTLLPLIGSSIFISIICLLPDVFISGYVLPENKFTPEISKFWNGIYALYFIIFFILSLRNLFFKYKNSSDFWRLRIKHILIATMVGFIGGMIFSLFIPLLYSNVIDWVGPMFTFFTVGYIWYNIFYKPKEGLKILSDFRR